MYNTNKDDSDKLDIEKAIEGLDTATACALYPVLENHTPVDESEIGLSKPATAADITYERLLSERTDLEILTKREDYQSVTQKIHYRCKQCGEEYKERKDRLLTKQAGYGKPFPCKNCDELRRKYVTQTLTLQKTHYYVTSRGGKILNLIKSKDNNRKYITPSDKVCVQCKEGHQWIATHKHIHSGAWCLRCSAIHGINNEVAKLPNVRKGISRELEYYVWRKAASYFEMDVLFEIPGRPQREYFCQCHICKNVTILTAKQLSQRNYLCLNRCIPSNMPSLTEAIAASGYFIEHPDKKQAILTKEYAEATIRYNEWVKNKTIYPKPLKYKKRT